MTAPELKPCPFCGGEADIWRAHEGRTAWIACMGKCVVLISKEYLSDDEAIAAWNRRADLAAVQPAQVRVKPLTDLVEEFTTAVWHLMDNSETSGPIDDPTITVWKPDFDEVSKLLDRIEGLPSGSTEHMGAGELLSANILAALEPQPDPRDEVIARLVEENNWQIKARAQHWLRRTISAPEDAAVEEICEKYGYGAVMDAASRLWARKPYGSGAFYVGGCIGFKSDDEARAALAAAKAVMK